MLRTALLFLLVTFVASFPAPVMSAGDAIQLRYANFPPASTFPCVQMERWKDEVEKRTEGRIAVQTFPGGTLLGAKDMFRGVQMGQTDIGCVGLAYQPGVFPVSSAVELPLGFDSASVASMVLYDLVQETNPEEFSGVKVLTMFTSAPSNLMTREQITTLDQIKGVEYRASGIASKVLERLGAVPVSMPMPDVPEALQKGLVKGLLTSMEVLKDMNFAEFCPYQTIGNFQVYTFAVIMNLKAWNSLPQDIQKILDDLAPEQALWTGRYMDGHVQNSLAWVHEKYGTSPVTLSAEDMETARQKLSPLVDEWKTMAESKALPSEDILTRIQRLKAKYETELN